MRLDVRNITVRAGQAILVSDASFSVSPGEFVGLIGPNGAGKSTLLKSVVGIRPRDAGEVMLDGKPIADFSPRERARRLAFLPQERRVEWRVPARDVVMLGRYPHHSGFGGATDADREAVADAIARVDAASVEDRPAAVLSAGEKTRVLLARALAVRAPILLADEPIAALDPYHQLHVMEILRDEARAGRAILVVLHDLMLASRFMDRLILMSAGAIVAEGKPADVLSDERLRSVYRIGALRGEQGGIPWLSPWSRTDRPD
jgi:iron complex transport system ATP-binding protein